MPTFLLTLDATAAVATALADALGDDVMLADAAGAFDLGDGTWRLEAYCPERPDLDLFADAFAPMAAEAGGLALDAARALLGRAAVRPLDADDWSSYGLDTLAALRAGRFRIWGEHNRPQEEAAFGRHDLVIEASTAFGTGDHASTLLSLAALDRVLKRRRPRNILDLGTGTGILGLAALKAVPDARVIASDIEPVAVRTAERNRRLNAVGARFTARLADGLADPVIRAAAPFDLVLANILPDPLCRLAGPLVPLMAPGAMLVVAGLRIGERSRLIAAYRARGLVPVASTAIKEWASLAFEKPLASARRPRR